MYISKLKYKKHILAEKLDVVRMVCEEGRSRHETAVQMGIDLRLVRLWVDIYSNHGVDGLSNKNGPYPIEFKLSVLHDSQKNNLSLTAAGVKYQIAPSVIRQWKLRYVQSGTSGLTKPRGRPPKNVMIKKTSPKKPLTREQELEEENAYLRAENAYLKKLRALVEERVAREREIGREPSKH